MTRVVRVPKGSPSRAAAPPDPSRVGTTHGNKTVDGFASSVLAAGWTVGMSIVGASLQADTTVDQIAADGLSLTLSKDANVGAAGAQPLAQPLTVKASKQWVQVGPAITVNGPARGKPRIAGRFRALAVHQNGQRVYAGSILGGVWYSEDGGASWMSLDFYSSTKDRAGALSFADALTVGALAVKWGANAAADVVYVGAGEHPLTELKVKNSPDSTAQGIGIRLATGPADKVLTSGAAAADPWRLEATDLTGVVVNALALDIKTDGVVWAATSQGLFMRPAAGGASWTNVATGLGDVEMSDVVVVAGVAPEAERVYVASLDGRVARFIDGGAWAPVPLPALAAVPGAAAAPAPQPIRRMRLAGGNVPGHAVVYAVADGPRLWRIDGDAAGPVSGLPANIFDGDATSPELPGMAVVAHPANDAAHQDMIAVGGNAYASAGGAAQAAIFVGRLTQGAGGWSFPSAAVAAGQPRAEWVGDGVPAGVQALGWVAGAGPTQLWVAGDSGIYRSAKEASRGSFLDRNTGLAAADVSALSQSSGTGEVLLMGTRTSGALRRVNAETWKVTLAGGKGGVAIDPADALHMYAQVAGAWWQESTDGGATWADVLFTSERPPGIAGADLAAWTNAIKQEVDAAAPIARLGLISNTCGGAGTQRALGTDRIWYSDQSAPAPMTGNTTAGSPSLDHLPASVLRAGWQRGMAVSSSDAAAGIPANTIITSIAADGLAVVLSNPATATAVGVPLTATRQARDHGWMTLPTASDPFGGARADRLQDALDASVLMSRWGSVDRLYVLTYTSVYLFERSAAGAWLAVQHLYDQVDVKKRTKLKTPRGEIPADLRLTTLEVHDATIGKGTLYVGASGNSDEEHVWWFDGTSKWVDTKLKAQLDTPVHTLVVDPANRNVVYAGTDAGVWKGIGSFTAAGSPAWAWTHFSDALPEAPCVELLITEPTLDTQPGNTHAASPLVDGFATDVRRAGWEVGMPITGGDIPANTTIESIANDGLSLQLSNPAGADAGNGMMLSAPANRSLRAALAGLGVWEVALNPGYVQGPEVYLRAHRHDSRRAPVSAGGPRDPLQPARSQVRLDASPDIRVWRRPWAIANDAKTGDTTLASTKIINLASDVFAAGWRVGDAINGVPIAADTTIVSIAADGLSLQLSAPATATAAGVALTASVRRDTQTGDTHANTTIDHLAVDVRAAGWTAGMSIVGAGIKPGTTIVSIDAANGRSLVLSQNANAPAAAATALTVFPLVPRAAVPLDSTSESYDVWLLQEAMRLAGEDIEPDGVWSRPTEQARGRVRVAQIGGAAAPPPLPPPPAVPPPAVLAAFETWHRDTWQAIVGRATLPNDYASPDPADLAAHFQDQPDRWPKGVPSSCASDAIACVQVTLHSRHWKTIAATPNPRVTVALLKTPYGRRQSLKSIAPLPAGWAASLQADRAAPNGIWMGPAGPAKKWFYGDSANPANSFKGVNVPLDPNEPRVVTFDIDLSADGAFDKPGWLLVAVVLSEDDPLTTTETDVEILVSQDHHVAARSVRKAAFLAEPYKILAGTDNYAYPGQAVMDHFWSNSNSFFTGLYLSQLHKPAIEKPEAQHLAAPPFTSPTFTSGEFIVPGTVAAPALPPGTPPAALGAPVVNYRGHANASWSTQWANTVADFGVAPIYFGHQDPHNVDFDPAHAPPSWLAKGPFDLREVIGVANADDAAAKAAGAGMPAGTVIYFDWEADNLNWVLKTAPPAAVAVVASAKDYCVAFLRRLAESGYRPGLYCRQAVGAILRAECPGLFIWNAGNDHPPNPLSIENAEGGPQLVISTTTKLMEDFPNSISYHANTIARQWRLDIALPAGNPVWNPVAPAPPLHVDLDASVVENPAFPERGQLPGSILAGRVAITRWTPSNCAVYAVRSGLPVRVLPGKPIATLDHTERHWWNAFSCPSALRFPGPPADPIAWNVFAALGSVSPGGIDRWLLQVQTQRDGGRWLHETIPDGGVKIDPLPGAVVITRSDQSIDAFVVDDDTGQIAGSHRDPASCAWSPLAALRSPGGIASSKSRRTNRPAAVSREQGVADVFWVSSEVGVGQCSANTVAGSVAIPVAELADFPPSGWAIISNSDIVRFAGRTAVAGPGSLTGIPAAGAGSITDTILANSPILAFGPTHGLLNTTSSASASPSEWSAPTQIGDPAVRVHPLGNLAAVSTGQNRMDVLFIGRADGAAAWSLYDVFWTNVDQWGAGAAHTINVGLIAGPPAVDLEPLAAIAAAALDANTVHAFVIGRDGALYFAQPLAAAAAPFTRIGRWENTQNGTTIAGSASMTAIAANVLTAGWKVGMSISGAGIPADTTIVRISANGLRVTLSKAAVAGAAANTPITASVGLARVDGACSSGANDIEVAVTDAMGNVCTTHWDSGPGAYTALERVTPLNVP